MNAMLLEIESNLMISNLDNTVNHQKADSHIFLEQSFFYFRNQFVINFIRNKV